MTEFIVGHSYKLKEGVNVSEWCIERKSNFIDGQVRKLIEIKQIVPPDEKYNNSTYIIERDAQRNYTDYLLLFEGADNAKGNGWWYKAEDFEEVK